MMLEQGPVMERREQSMEQLKTLLKTRTQTLSLFSELAGRRPFKPEPAVQELLQAFCEALVDYTASAHFQLYRHVQNGDERRQNVREISEQVYRRITDATAHILDFNDKYDCEDRCDDLACLADDLSRLGEILADRINMEDRIIAVMRQPRG